MWVLTRRWWLISVALFVPGAVCLILGLRNPRLRTDDGMSLVKFGLLWILLMVLIHAGLFGFFAFQRKRSAFFAAQGIPGTATVLSAAATGTEVNNMPQVEMKLLIEVPGREASTIIHREVVNPVFLAQLQRGAQLPVLVHPRKPKKVMLRYE